MGVVNKDGWDREVLYHLTHSTSPPDICLSGKGKCKPTGEIILMNFFSSVELECGYWKKFVTVDKL